LDHKSFRHQPELDYHRNQVGFLENRIMDHKQKNELIRNLNADIDDANDAITELLTYLSSKKFRCGNELDGYVNVSDVRSRVLLIKENL
jgi:hypothetical protein